MRDYPRALPRIDQVEPVPRRVRAVKDGVVVVDTVAAHYVFEWAFYPQFHLPLADVRTDLLVPTGETSPSGRGTAQWHDLATGHSRTARAARVTTAATDPVLTDTVRFEWDALDSWYEEDEEVYVHPRNPYTSVEAVRSSRHVRVELDGVLLAESAAPVLVFETGLPTRYYLDRTTVRWERLTPSDTRSACPYKGRTTGYWSARSDVGAGSGPAGADIAWSYEFTTRALTPIAGLVAFLDEKVDVVVDGVRRARPKTHFS